MKLKKMAIKLEKMKIKKTPTEQLIKEYRILKDKLDKTDKELINGKHIDRIMDKYIRISRKMENIQEELEDREVYLCEFFDDIWDI